MDLLDQASSTSLCMFKGALFFKTVICFPLTLKQAAQTTSKVQAFCLSKSTVRTDALKEANQDAWPYFAWLTNVILVWNAPHIFLHTICFFFSLEVFRVLSDQARSIHKQLYKVAAVDFSGYLATYATTLLPYNIFVSISYRLYHLLFFLISCF